jgi:putative hydrolase of the HAD superfamily
VSQITAVTFDLWQTLLLDNRETGRARTQVRLEGAKNTLAKFGETYSMDQLELAYQSGTQQCHAIRGEHRDVSFREQVTIFVEGICSDLSERLPEELFQEIAVAYADSFFVHPPRPHPDALAVLDGVKALGLRMGMISNTGMTPGVAFRRFLEQHGMLGYFDILVFSDEVKVCKPSCEIFLMTLRELDAAPEQTIHVGDSVTTDVMGAKRCGLKTVWIEGFSQRENPNDPWSEADASVAELALALPAIQRIAGLGEF